MSYVNALSQIGVRCPTCRRRAGAEAEVPGTPCSPQSQRTWAHTGSRSGVGLHGSEHRFSSNVYDSIKALLVALADPEEEAEGRPGEETTSEAAEKATNVEEGRQSVSLTATVVCPDFCTRLVKCPLPGGVVSNRSPRVSKLLPIARPSLCLILSGKVQFCTR